MIRRIIIESDVGLVSRLVASASSAIGLLAKFARSLGAAADDDDDARGWRLASECNRTLVPSRKSEAATATSGLGAAHTHTRMQRRRSQNHTRTIGGGQLVGKPARETLKLSPSERAPQTRRSTKTHNGAEPRHWVAEVRTGLGKCKMGANTKEASSPLPGLTWV